MLAALRKAFWLRWPVRGLGDVPVNVLGLTSLGILGLANPGFWLVAVGLETAYLATLVTNRRFLRWVEADDRAAEDGSVEAKRRALAQQLGADDRKALDRLAGRGAQIESLWRASQADEFLFETNAQALNELQWSYLKLLIARQHLTGADADADADELRADAATLDRELKDATLTQAARESKVATLAILKRRAENFSRRQATIEEITSDLERIDAQVQLVLENARIDGKPPAISTTLNLASSTLDAGVFGSSAADVADVDALYSQAPRARERA